MGLEHVEINLSGLFYPEYWPTADWDAYVIARTAPQRAQIVAKVIDDFILANS
jgi:hypothetical protein